MNFIYIQELISPTAHKGDFNLTNHSTSVLHIHNFSEMLSSETKQCVPLAGTYKECSYFVLVPRMPELYKYIKHSGIIYI